MSDKRVMIADDDEDMRELLSTVLARASYTVVGAAVDGDDALEMWREQRPHGVCAVILDQRMPGLFGTEVARLIRAEAPNQVIILLSAYIDAETERLAMQVGIAACVPKEALLDLASHPALLAACAEPT